MCKQNLDLCVRELGLNYFQSCSHQKPKSFAKSVGNLTNFQLGKLVSGADLK